MELLPKKKAITLKLIYVGILFLFIFSGILGLYGYIWNMLKTSVAKTVARDFYLEGVARDCTSNADCRDVCQQQGERLGPDEACICLKRRCHYVSGAQFFSQPKFCEHDSDCTVSCFEGPVNKAYYDLAGGASNDCSGGCADASMLRTNGNSNITICRNRQCQYADGHTCFSAVMPGVTL